MQSPGQKLLDLSLSSSQGKWVFDADWQRLPTILAPDEWTEHKGNQKVAIMEKSGWPEKHARTIQQESNAELIALLQNNLPLLIQLVQEMESKK